jgi:putative hydrolase
VGYVPAVAAFVRMSELTPASANRDFHMHTRYTDGKAEVAQMLRRAEETGLSEVAFTEHVRRDSSWFVRFAAEVRAAASGSAVRVWVGCESRILDEDGNLDINDEIRDLCDIVLASVHRFPGPDGAPRAFSQVPKHEFAGIERALSLGFLRRGGADVLAHPGGMSLRYGEGFPEEYFTELAEAAKAAGIAIELNSSYTKDLAPVIRAYRKVDPLVSVASDAHDVCEIATCREILKDLLWPS